MFQFPDQLSACEACRFLNSSFYSSTLVFREWESLILSLHREGHVKTCQQNTCTYFCVIEDTQLGVQCGKYAESLSGDNFTVVVWNVRLVFCKGLDTRTSDRSRVLGRLSRLPLVYWLLNRWQTTRLPNPFLDFRFLHPINGRHLLFVCHSSQSCSVSSSVQGIWQCLDHITSIKVVSWRLPRKSLFTSPTLLKRRG